jgi:hypothetical protein
VAEPLSNETLLNLYRIALDEYRFEVRLGWDRTTYFLVLNSGILAAATGLLKLDGPPVIYALVAILFMFGAATSYAGSKAISTAHRYYRRTVVKKATIERCLGLTNPIDGMHPLLNLAVGTTDGQKDHNILTDPDRYVNKKDRRTSITYFMKWILRSMAIVDLTAAGLSFTMMCYRFHGSGGSVFLRTAFYLSS